MIEKEYNHERWVEYFFSISVVMILLICPLFGVPLKTALVLCTPFVVMGITHRIVILFVRKMRNKYPYLNER